MNFEFSEEQNLLRDSISSFIQNEYGFDKRRAVANSDEGYSHVHWQTFAELGWLSVPFKEDVGGFGGSAIDTMVVMEELGKGLVLEPYLINVVMFGQLLEAGNKGELLELLIAGQMQGAIAYAERQSRYNFNDVLTKAQKTDDGYLISGKKTVVYNGAVAQKLVVLARTEGEQMDQSGLTLFLVDAAAAGVSRTPFKMMDGQRVADIAFDNVAVQQGAIIGELNAGLPLMQSVVNQAIVAAGAEALGIMQVLLDTTVEYSKTRRQFGTEIGQFQALQHRMVDMMIACEQTKSLLYRAACALASDRPSPETDVLALKVMVGRAGKLIGDEALQLHGGIGMTDDLNVGHYVKRLMMINTFLGDADYSQRKLAKLSLAS